MVLSGSNPTLSANLSLFRINNLTGYVGSVRAIVLFSGTNLPSNLLKITLQIGTWVH
jgi:hypothetical protein